MEPLKDPISVRAIRLNNIILGKTSGTLATKPTPRFSIDSGVNTFSIGNVLADALSREGLLDAFCLLYNECEKDALVKRDRNISDFVNKYRPILSEAQKLRVNLEDFIVKDKIGKGHFGNVHMVVERQTGDVYAMKKIRKTVASKSQVREERDITRRRCSEWIVKLQYAFQDCDNLYLVMEYLPGGDLLNLMARIGPFDEEMTRFYLAELTLAINALHDMGYVHRDIKPENILIDRFGHIKLADFGNAAALNRDGHVLSLAPVGTPDYIAPELLETISTYKMSKTVHDVSCDFWSMGIIGYELICEETPFHESNVHETYAKILSHGANSEYKVNIAFPSDFKLSSNFKNLIESLVTNCTNRLNYEGIRNHAFFASIVWEKLRSQVPPFIPTVHSDQDTSNFEVVGRFANDRSVIQKKSLTSGLKSNDFSGKDLPFLGYTFVYQDPISIEEPGSEGRIIKLTAKVKELEAKRTEHAAEIMKQKRDLMRAEEMSRQTISLSKLLHDAKDEVNKMKEIIQEKTVELAACNSQIRTLQSSVKVDEEMWEKKEAAITEMLRMNRQKYEDAKISSEQRYEKLIAESKNELSAIMRKLDARETELAAKNEECKHLIEKMQNYKDMLHGFKEKAQQDRIEFDKNKMELTESYEQKLLELRKKILHEEDSKTRLSMGLNELRTEMQQLKSSTISSEEAKKASAKNTDEILRRLNSEIESNHILHTHNAELGKKLNKAQKTVQDLEQEVQRLERELQVVECGKNLAQSEIMGNSTPYKTARGSLSDMEDTETQLRAELQAVKESESVHKERADKLEESIKRLEEMMENFNSSPSKDGRLPADQPLPAPRNIQTNANAVDELLEKKNLQLEDKLAAVREQMIVERQAARSANLALWKAEKKLEESLTEKKMTQRRMQLTEERIKKVQSERDEAQRSCKTQQEETQKCKERIKELKQELDQLHNVALKEHENWQQCEKERMKCKTELVNHIAESHKLEAKLGNLRLKLEQLQQTNRVTNDENSRLQQEIESEREKHSKASETIYELNTRLKNLQSNYDTLKYACTITDRQLTEIEQMLEAEQRRTKAQQDKIDHLNNVQREREEAVMNLKKELNIEQGHKKAAEKRVQMLLAELDRESAVTAELKKKLEGKQEEQSQQTDAYNNLLERLEIITNEVTTLLAANESCERQIKILKEENSNALSQLYYAKEQCQELQDEVKNVMAKLAEANNEVEALKFELCEKESFFAERNIKSDATLEQYKKLIDYLQIKVEDLSTQKKKKNLVNRFFGQSSGNNDGASLSSNAIENSILYRTLKEELRREKHHSKTLQDEINKLTSTSTDEKAVLLRSPKNKSFEKDVKDEKSAIGTLPKTTKPHKIQWEPQVQEHRFELVLQENSTISGECFACKKLIVAGTSCWMCKECKEIVHRKCRSNVKTMCGHNTEEKDEVTEKKIEPDNSDLDSIGKFSYEPKMDQEDTDNEMGVQVMGTTLILGDRLMKEVEVNCAVEIEQNHTLLLGCKSGLYAFHLPQHKFESSSKSLLRVEGINSVNCIAISVPLAKAILVSSSGDTLYQCDYRQLLSRCQSTVSSSNNRSCPIEGSIIDLPFAARGADEKWQMVRISNEVENALDTTAIAATATRIIIMKYNLDLGRFQPTRSLDTSAPVSSITFTKLTAIVSSDKFFEIDLESYTGDEFADISDSSLACTNGFQPVTAVRISPVEFLLCFMECGIFVDEYGCRSRPYNLNWEFTPTGFLYQSPFLYISHFQSLQILRLNRFYSNEIAEKSTIAAGNKRSSKNNEDMDINQPQFKRIYIPFDAPALLTESGNLDAYIITMQKGDKSSNIYHIDALGVYKQKFNESLETLSSVLSGLTVDTMSST